MREIKFRAWDEQSKKMFKDVTHSYGILPINEMLRIEGQLSTGFYELSHSGRERFTTMQYTGLKDKSGNEIYEGDIVRFSKHYCGDSTIPENIEVIEYELNGFTDSLQIGYMDCPEWCEIIGNIYENPELLED